MDEEDLPLSKLKKRKILLERLGLIEQKKNKLAKLDVAKFNIYVRTVVALAQLTQVLTARLHSSELIRVRAEVSFFVVTFFWF